MEQFIRYVVGEMRVIADAPMNFSVAVLALATAIWWLMDWRYSGIIANRDSEISSLKTQRDEYKDKLGGASPDQAKARIEALERTVRSILPRRLTAEQMNILANTLRGGTGRQILIMHDMSCPDCNGYAGDLIAVFISAGWEVANGGVIGPARTIASNKGLAIQMPNATPVSADQKLVITAFERIGIPFEIKELNSPPGSGHLKIALMVTAAMQ